MLVRFEGVLVGLVNIIVTVTSSHHLRSRRVIIHLMTAFTHELTVCIICFSSGAWRVYRLQRML